MKLRGWFGGHGRDAFGRARGGNVAMLWALMGAVLIGFVGLTVDFTRAQQLRAQLQNAADGAALAAERSSSMTLAQRRAAARAYFDSEMGAANPSVTFNVVQMQEGGHRVTVTMPMPLGLARVIRNEDWLIDVVAEAQADASPPVEVALVLDNTGSMANDMGNLREAATDLAIKLFNIDGDAISISLVPFVAQVNIGNGAAQMAWMDTPGSAPYNGELLEDRQIGRRTWEVSSGENCENLPTLPFNGYTGPYRINWVRTNDAVLLNTCRAFTPENINYLTLYDLLPNEDWKGCVEARPEPFDINDAPPTTNEARFVPYFWVDTLDNGSNSYLSDTIGDITSPGGATNVTMSNGSIGSPTAAERNRAYVFNVFKYRDQAITLDTSPPETRGPNRGCPTPIIPLSTDRDTILTGIDAMRHWSGGGTNQVEGLAWGWRVLSPGAPFTQGRPYGDDVRKVIVLMSDGENTNVGSDAVWRSDYSANNHLGLWQDYDDGNLLNGLYGLIGGLLHGILPPAYQKNISSAGQAVAYINSREAALCNNIKAQNIEIYTVIFRETDPATEALMRNCATDTDHFYRADNAQELNEAFEAIGSGIGQLRLTH